jgi:hypothetical protein
MNPCPRLMASGGTLAGLPVVSEVSQGRVEHVREDGPYIELLGPSCYHTFGLGEDGGGSRHFV